MHPGANTKTCQNASSLSPRLCHRDLQLIGPWGGALYDRLLRFLSISREKEKTFQARDVENGGEYIPPRESYHVKSTSQT